MNKTKMVLAVTGGVIGLAVLAMGYFTWSAFSAKTAAIEGDDEGNDGLDAVVSKAQALSRKPIYPCAASVSALKSNETLVATWKDEAGKLASRGDKVFAKTTSAAFKTFIVADAKRLSALPGAVGGVLVKPDFAFGPFKDYIAEGKMPAESQLAELQRKWDDVATVVETLAKCGIAELLDVQFKTVEVKEGPKDAKKNKKANNKNDKKTAASENAEPVAYTYVFTFATRPVGFVKAINALETSDRFAVVDDFGFSRVKDVIADALGGEEKKAEAQATGRRSRRRAAAAEAEEKKEAETPAKNGIITDPVLDAPFTVSMTVTVYDFRSLDGEAKDEEQKEEVSK